MPKKNTYDDFIRKAGEVHGDKYDYHLVEYSTNLTPVTIHCKLHGNFKMTPKMHIRGQGCSLCGRIRQISKASSNKDEFVIKSREVHGDKYEYESVVYVNSQTLVEITCNKCLNNFSQRPNNHLRGVGCSFCGEKSSCTTRKEKSKIKFFKDAPNIHECKYDYSLVEFKDMSTHVTVLCPEHQEFSITPHKHILGGGCPSCSSGGYSPRKEGTLYVLHELNSDITKVGITNRTPRARLYHINYDSGKNFEEFTHWSFTNGHTARALETELLRYMRNLYKEVEEKFDGSTECFYNVDRCKLKSKIEELIKEHKEAR